MKITDYLLVESPSSETIEFEVEQLLESGWQPLGPASVCWAADSGVALFVQTMVRYEPPCPDASKGA